MSTTDKRRDAIGTTATTLAAELIEGLAGGGHTAFIDGARADGYVVGGAARPLEFDSEDDVTGSAVRAWIAAVLTGHPSVSRGQAIDTIGSWIDAETGRVYFDAGTVHDDRHGAILTARSIGELAIWDIAEAREVRIY